MTPVANSSENYTLTVLTNEKVPASLCGLSANMRRKNVRLGVVAVQIRNPMTNQSIYVYAFQDGRSQLTLLRKSVANEIGLHGMPHIQPCLGMHAMANILMESVDLQIRGIHETEAFDITDVKITDIVPELQHSLPGTLRFEEYENFCDLTYPTINHDR